MQGKILAVLLLCGLWASPARGGGERLPDIDISGAPSGIVRLPRVVPAVFRRVFVKYTKVVAPSGRPIHILAQSGWRDDQIVHVRNVLVHFLTRVPGSKLGRDKTKVANAMALRRATMVLFDDIEQMERAFDGDLGEVDLAMQDLRANECTAIGGVDYMRHLTRDATYEEVLHLVHDYGIRPVLRSYDEAIHRANLAAARRGLWRPWPRDEPENHRNEYLAAIYDNYLDLWAVLPRKYEGEPISRREVPRGTSHFGAFRADSRARLKQVDPVGHALIEQWFADHLTFTAVLPRAFEGVFQMSLDPDKPYTHKSRHLRYAQLRGSAPASLVGNRHDNRLGGNRGNNRLDGGAGVDTALFSGRRSDYTIRRSGALLIVTDRRKAGDGSDTLVRIEKLRFSDGIVAARSIAER